MFFDQHLSPSDLQSQEISRSIYESVFQRNGSITNILLKDIANNLLESLRGALSSREGVKIRFGQLP